MTPRRKSRQSSRPLSANKREADGSLTHVSPGLVHGNSLRTPRVSADQARTPQFSAEVAGRTSRQQQLAGDSGLARIIAEGPASWEISNRACERRDLGRPCRGCGAPFTRVGDPMYVWKAATFVKRFHPGCAERFDGHEAKSTGPHYSNVDAMESGIDAYADAWRRSQLSERSVQLTAERQAARRATERWPRYPTAGMLWRAGTLALQQERKDAEGVAAWKRQIQALQTFTKECGGATLLLEDDAHMECAICLGSLDVAPDADAQIIQRSAVLMLPCDRSHAFHTHCLEPWLQRSFQCPKCRADLRPLLDSNTLKSVVESIKTFHKGKGGIGAATSLGKRTTVE